MLLPVPDKEIKKQEIIPITVVDITKEEIHKKEKPVPKKQAKKIISETKKKDVKKQAEQRSENVNNNKQNNVSKKDNSKNDKINKTDNSIKEASKEAKPFQPKGADEPLILPDIKVPLAENMEIPEIKIPDILESEVKKENTEKNKDINIAEELSSLQSDSSADKSGDFGNKSVTNEINKEAEQQKKQEKSNLYNFDIAPTGNRKVLYVPEDPVFALTNDTSVTIRFNIDKAGNTYNIIFISRSSIDIEKLAYNYINNMKFDAIIEDRVDFAQITMFFKVQQ